MSKAERERTMSFWGAVSLGVGAIVGGGILALAGPAFHLAGPAAIIAFSLNGVIALITAISFGEMSKRFPESGGTYTFAKKIFPVRTAFSVGWVVWFASLVAATLYAVGTGAFLVPIMEHLVRATSGIDFQIQNWHVTGTAILVTIIFNLILNLKRNPGGEWMSLAKVICFAILILFGIYIFTSNPLEATTRDFTPFMPNGFSGVLQAMGVTFIALQGFDLISAAGGDIKDPKKNISKAMIISLLIALAVYIPILFILVGTPKPQGMDIVFLSQTYPETVVAQVAKIMMGSFGYWLIMIAGVLSMLSALFANVIASSKIAVSMAYDRTLPVLLAHRNPDRKTYRHATTISCIFIIMLLLLLSDVTLAGAASSLIFLLSFMLAHLIYIIMEKRAPGEVTKMTKVSRVTSRIGFVCCLSLSLYQGFQAPKAGILVLAWLVIGAIFYMLFLSQRARIADAQSEGSNPELIRLRGKKSLALVPIANPNNTKALLSVASSLNSEYEDSTMLLSVVKTTDNKEENMQRAQVTQEILQKCIELALEEDYYPESLITMAPNPWAEILRTSAFYDASILIMGVKELNIHVLNNQVSDLALRTRTDLALLRSPEGWRVKQCKKVLIPVSGGIQNSEMRARFLNRLYSQHPLEITYLSVQSPEGTSRYLMRNLTNLIKDECPYSPEIRIEYEVNVASTIQAISKEFDLVVMGLQEIKPGQPMFSEMICDIVNHIESPFILLAQHSHRGH